MSKRSNRIKDKGLNVHYGDFTKEDTEGEEIGRKADTLKEKGNLMVKNID